MTRLQIYLYHANQTAHPQRTTTVDDAANATTDITAALEGKFQLMGLKIIKEDSIVAPYPQPIVITVISQSANEIQQRLQLWLYRETSYLRRIFNIYTIDASAPCANPQMSHGHRRQA
jgi:hypothetical protein